MAFWNRSRWTETRASQDDCILIADRLSQLGLFEGAPRRALERLATEVRVVDVPAGQTVIKEGRMPGDLFVVASGELDVLSTGEHGGAAEKVNELTAGDWFGEIGLIEGMPSTASVTTAGRCVLYRIPGREFLSVINTMPALSHALVEKIAGGLAATHASYRPAADASLRTPAEGPAAETFRELVTLSSVLDDDELTRLNAWLQRLRARTREERARLLDGE